MSEVRRHTPEELLERFLSLAPEERDAEFWTIQQVARWVRKREQTVKRWIYEGKVDYTKVAGTLYVHTPHLRIWLMAQVGELV